MPATIVPPLDCAEVSEEILRWISRREPHVEGIARRHLARLTPDRWTIEWHLPWWLGQRFGLDPELAMALVRSNVLGMLAVRLEDDLEDGEIPASEMAGARLLARVAFDEAVVAYRTWYGTDSPVWEYLHRSMAAWRTGATGTEPAARGAPIKIAAYGCCLSAGRFDAWPAMEQTLDRAVTALVLCDQFVDWESDLDAGRWNGFVATIVGGRQEPAARARNRAAVLTSMLTTNVVREHFDAMRREATEGARLAAELGITQLAAFLETWALRVSEQGANVDERYRIAADQATRLFFGTRLGGVTA